MVGKDSVLSTSFDESFNQKLSVFDLYQTKCGGLGGMQLLTFG